MYTVVRLGHFADWSEVQLEVSLLETLHVMEVTLLCHFALSEIGPKSSCWFAKELDQHCHLWSATHTVCSVCTSRQVPSLVLQLFCPRKGGVHVRNSELLGKERGY